MPLDNYSLNVIASKLKEEMISSKIGRPFYLGDNVYALPYNKTVNENINHGSFIFSLNPTNPFVCYSKDRFNKIDDNRVFYNALKRLSNGIVTDVRKHSGERILSIDIEADRENILLKDQSYTLILELFPQRPNCYITAHPKDTIQVVYKERIDLQKEIYLARNFPYIYPEEKTSLPRHLSECEDARSYLPNSTLKMLKEYVSGGNSLDEALNSLNDSTSLYIIGNNIFNFNFKRSDAINVEVKDIYSTFYKDQKDQARLDKVKDITVLLEKAIKKANKKKDNLLLDLSNSKLNLKYLDYGQKIYQYQTEIKKGDSSLNVEGIKIDLNPRESISKNAAFYFKKYSKAKAAIPILERLITDTNSEIEYLNKKLLEVKDGTPRDIMELKSELLETGYLKVKPGRTTAYKVSSKHKYEPHYIQNDEFKIGFGMNGLQNEELTFNIAKKDDLFIHVKDYPGSHVLILENENDDSFKLGCELALYLSHMDKGEVLYTQRKNVKKNPFKIGLVNILKYESIYISEIRDESIKLFKQLLKKD